MHTISYNSGLKSFKMVQLTRFDAPLLSTVAGRLPYLKPGFRILLDGTSFSPQKFQQNPKCMFFMDTYNIKVNDNVLYKTGLASITISSSSSRSFPRLPLIIIPHYSRFTTGPIWRPSNPSGCTATKWSLKTYLPSIMLNKTMVL